MPLSAMSSSAASWKRRLAFGPPLAIYGAREGQTGWTRWNCAPLLTWDDTTAPERLDGSDAPTDPMLGIRPRPMVLRGWTSARP